MELPSRLKDLYCHWGQHTGTIPKPLAPEEVFADPEIFANISWFIKERLNIWQKKIYGSPLPFTNDHILSRYRFCNIFREFDRQTIEFHTLLNPLRGDFPLWLLNMFYCRMVARTETIKIVGFLSFDTKANDVFYNNLMACPRPRFGTPYVFPVSAILKSPTPTRELFIVKYLPTVMNMVAQEILTWKKISAVDGVKKILPIFGHNLEFLWAEVLIDVAYQFPKFINLFKRFPVGPGAQPTFKKINSAKEPTVLAEELSRVAFNTGLTFNGKFLRLSAENWEGVGCEYRKYTNLKQGVGRRRIYSA